METLRRCKLHFVHCLLPQANAGLSELRASQLPPNQTVTSDDLMLNVPLTRQQIRGVQLIDAIRIHRQGEVRIHRQGKRSWPTPRIFQGEVRFFAKIILRLFAPKDSRNGILSTFLHFKTKGHLMQIEVKYRRFFGRPQQSKKTPC